jgi:pSer/pThr/pTyr-binding forkhead associated (FHA) protein
MAREDWRSLVASRTCEEFADANPYPFLLSLSGLIAPSPPPRTVRREESVQVAELQAERRRRITPPDRQPAVLPVRKSQPTFTNMITVGRAGNNDIVVPDALVSKFHAVFRVSDGQWDLADVGSANGTRIGATVLAPKGPPHPLRSGDKLAFGDQTFHFLDAASLWISLR